MTENSSSVNIPLLRKAVEWVEAQAALPKKKREWNQQEWASECGTGCCVAGYIGQTLDPAYEGNPAPNGRLHVSDFAADALDIDCDEAEAFGGLFFANNTAEDIRRIAEDIAGERL